MSLIKRSTKVTLEGKGVLTLRPSDYVTQGGEGAIYRKGADIIKLYLDPKKMQHDDISSKVRLLANRIDHASIVSPKGIVSDNKGNPIGYHMPYVSGEAFPRLFTGNFRDQNGFGSKQTVTLTSKMHEVVQYVHGKKILMVDANELNWLADISDVNDPVPYVIDVDSWEIGKFKASVIMPSIRDWHSGGISEESDWFAWGVVSFLLFTGIHPYKGKLDGYKPGELEKRMKDNASVFLPQVRLNRAVRDFKEIPGPLLDWYQATFTDGERSIPPSPLQVGGGRTAVGRVFRTVTTATGGLVYEKLFEIVGEKVISVWPCGVLRTESGSLIEFSSKKVIGKATGKRVAVVSRSGGWLVVEEVAGSWQWRFISRKGDEFSLIVPLDITGVVRSGERIFAVTTTEFVEIVIQQFQKPVTTIGNRWQIMGNATNWYREIGVSDVLGATYLIVPFNEGSVAMVRVPEFDGLTTVSAVGGGRFAEIVTLNQQGEYQTHSLSFNSDWNKYKVSTRTVDGPEQNITILPKGVVASIPEDEQLVITVPSKGAQKIVNDKDLATNMYLSRIGDQVVYLNDGVLWSLKMN